MNALLKISLLSFSLMLAYSSSLLAQTVSATSKGVTMDFGYPKLQVLDDVTFTDENDDDLLSAGEAMLIGFTIENKGKYPAVNVKVIPQELNNIPGLDLADPVEIGEIPPGEKREVRVGIGSSDDLADGTASFVFRIEENGTFENISVPYVVSTRAREE
ncbi:MAG: hypothetical protein AAF399_28250 [Bacteroidota bacterium]